MSERGATPVLDYQRLLLTEQRFPPRWVLIALVVVAIAIATLSGATLLFFKHAHAPASMRWTLLGPALGSLALALGCTIHGVTCVYADRFELIVRCGPLRIWRRVIGWYHIKSISVVHRPGSGFRAIGIGWRMRVYMFGGEGVQLNLADETQLLVGSSDSKKLLETIEQARGASR